MKKLISSSKELKLFVYVSARWLAYSVMDLSCLELYKVVVRFSSSTNGILFIPNKNNKLLLIFREYKLFEFV
jgi:hypothetical protein